MVNTCRVGRAFRWRADQPCSLDDLVRIVRESDSTLVVMANAGEDGFSSCWAPGSRLVLDEFESAWAGTEGSLRTRLERSVQHVHARFRSEARTLDKYVPEDDMGGPVGTYTALAIGNDEVVAAWIGGDL